MSEFVEGVVFSGRVCDGGHVREHFSVKGIKCGMTTSASRSAMNTSQPARRGSLLNQTGEIHRTSVVLTYIRGETTDRVIKSLYRPDCSGRKATFRPFHHHSRRRVSSRQENPDCLSSCEAKARGDRGEITPAPKCRSIVDRIVWHAPVQGVCHGVCWFLCCPSDSRSAFH